LEVFPNFFLAVFKEIQQSGDGAFAVFTMDQLDGLKQFVEQDRLTLVGYNNFHFDDPILKQLLKGAVKSTEESTSSLNWRSAIVRKTRRSSTGSAMSLRHGLVSIYSRFLAVGALREALSPTRYGSECLMSRTYP
jgi:hypothetical protein